MPNLLEQGAAWLDQQRHAHTTTTVTYRRAPGSELQLQATVGQTVFRLDQGDGGTIRVVTRDYLIRTADLVIGGESVQPRRGDLIEEVIDGVTVTHEVHAPGGEPEWRYSDPYRNVIRIHTLHNEDIEL